MHRKSVANKTPPKKQSGIFPVEKLPKEEVGRVPFTARMPGDHLNSLQFISSEDIQAEKVRK